MLRIGEPQKEEEEEFLVLDHIDGASFWWAVSRHKGNSCRGEDGRKEARSISLTPFSRNAPAQDPIPPRSFSTSSSLSYSLRLSKLRYVIFARR